MKRLRILILVMAGAFSDSCRRVAASDRLRADLTGYEEVPAVNPPSPVASFAPEISDDDAIHPL